MLEDNWYTKWLNKKPNNDTKFVQCMKEIEEYIVSVCMSNTWSIAYKDFDIEAHSYKIYIKDNETDKLVFVEIPSVKHNDNKWLSRIYYRSAMTLDDIRGKIEYRGHLLDLAAHVKWIMRE